MKDIFAFLGVALTFASLAPYILDIIAKKTKPNIVSWFTWTLLTSIATAAAFSAGEWQAAILTLANAIGTFMVVVLGLRNGIAKFTLFDALCQIGALVALTLWLINDSPVTAIVGVVFIDFLAVLPTIKHSWQSPDEETWQSFFLATIGPMFTILSLTTYHWENMLYPVYLAVADGLVMIVIIYRRKELGLDLDSPGQHETLHE